MVAPRTSSKPSRLRASTLRKRPFILPNAFSMGFYGPVRQLAPSPLDELPNSLSFVCRGVVHHHHLAFAQGRPQYLLRVGLEDPGGGSAFHGQRVGPIPSMVMLESRVGGSPSREASTSG